MVRALERGLSLLDFNELTVGMIIGFIMTYNQVNSEEKLEQEATQEDFDAF